MFMNSDNKCSSENNNCYYCGNIAPNDNLCELCNKIICDSHSLIEEAKDDSHLFCINGFCDYCGKKY